MGLLGAIKRVVMGSKEPTDLGDDVDVASWQQRIYAATQLAMYEAPVWSKLEKAVDGIFPGLISSVEADTFAGTPYEGRFRQGDQLDLNLMGRARNYWISFWDRFPTLKFARRPSSDVEVVDSLTRLVEKLSDEGGAVYECRRGMELSFTRGQDIVWPMFVRDRIQESEIVAGKIPASDFVRAAIEGGSVEIPLGADYEGIARAAQTALSPKGPAGEDNPFFFAMTEEQKQSLIQLQVRAQKMARKSKQPPHAIRPRAKIYFECTPYGSFCLVDPTVTDFEDVGWIARKIVMTPQEFQADPTFSDEAKREIKAQPLARIDKGTPVTSQPQYGLLSDGIHVADEQGRIVIWEIWDKIGWRRIYIAPGYPKHVGNSTRYPYMDLFGRPLFPDFFPCAWRTPWSRMRETPSRVLGNPGLEMMWAPQIEYIKCITGFVTACKSTARIFLCGPGVDPATQTQVAKAQDGTYIMPSQSYNPALHGPWDKQFVQLPMGDAPIDYLHAAEKVKHEAFEAVGITAASMTAAPQAPTATQETLISQGGSAIQGSMVSMFEDHYAELMWKALLMFLEYANPQEFEAYLGVDALKPRPSKNPPVQGADGQMVPQFEPSIAQVMQETDLVGERLECRFDPTSRTQNALRIKTLEDILTVASNVRDGAGMPFVDLKDILKQLCHEADVEVGDYKPTEAEIAMAVAAQMGNRQIGGGGDHEDGGDGRMAGGQRGKPAHDGRQSRDRGPEGDVSSSGNFHRRATAQA